MEAQCGKKATISSVIDEHGSMIEEEQMMREAFHGHFAQLFRRSKKLEWGDHLWDFLVSEPRLSAQEAEVCEGPNTATEAQVVLADFPRVKYPGLHGLVNELYKSLLELLADLL